MSERLNRILDGLVAGLIGFALVLEVFQGGAGIELAEPSLALASWAFVGAIGVLCALRASLARRLELPEARVLVPLCALVAAQWLSLLAAEDPEAALRRAVGWTGAALYAAVVIPFAASRRRAASLAAVALAASGVVAGLAARERSLETAEARALYSRDPSVARIAPGLREDFEARLFTDQASGPFTIPNGLGAYLALCSLGACGAALGARGAGPGRVVAAALSAALIAAIPLCAQKGAWLGLAGGTFVATLVLLEAHPGPRKALAIAGSAIAAAGACAFALLPVERLERLPGGLSLAVRKEYAAAALCMVCERPLSGVGAGNFAAHFSRLKPEKAEETRFAHDDYLEVLAESGPLGAAALAALWFFLVARAFRREREDRATPGATRPFGDGGAQGPEGGPGALGALVAGGALAFVSLLGLGSRYRDGATLFPAAAIFALASPLLARALRGGPTARASFFRAGAAGGAASFALQAAIDFLHAEPGILLTAIALAAAAPGLAGASQRSSLRLARPACLALPAAALALCAALALGLLPRWAAVDLARSEAERAIARGDLGGAEAAVEAGLEKAPGSTDLLVLLGDIGAERFRRSGDRSARDRALAAYERAIRGRSGLADIKRRAAEVARDDRAIELLDLAVSAYPSNPRYRLEAGLAHAERFLRLGEPEDRAAARGHLQEALRLSPRVRLARNRLGAQESEAARRALQSL